MNKSIEELHGEIFTLRERIITLSVHESVLKAKWENERIYEQVAHQKEQFKRFVPQRRGLGYVEPGSEECKQPRMSETRDPKATCSKRIQVAYIDLENNSTL